MRRRTNPARDFHVPQAEPFMEVFNRVAQVATEVFQTVITATVNLPFSPVPYGPIPGLYESPHGDLLAQGDIAVVELLQRHLGAGGKTTMEILAVVQLAGRYGARVLATPGSTISVQFQGRPVDRMLAMLDASGMQRIVGEGEWVWSE